jgi:long-chain acyl-CoA synthetase
MDKLANANKFNGLEKIKKLYLNPEAFTIENDLLTPSMKLKRGVAAKVFKEEIKTLYGQK